MLEKINGIHYIDNKKSSNYIKKILKEDKNSLILFTPDTNYANLEMLFDSVKKLIESIYYGTAKNVKNPFRNCKDSLEIFNLHKRI